MPGKEIYQGEHVQNCLCRGYVERGSRQGGKYPWGDVGKERQTRLGDGSRLRSRHVYCFRWYVGLKWNHDARCVYAWQCGEGDREVDDEVFGDHE
jgi:hypothetical protein